MNDEVFRQNDQTKIKHSEKRSLLVIRKTDDGDHSLFGVMDGNNDATRKKSIYNFV